MYPELTPSRVGGGSLSLLSALVGILLFTLGYERPSIGWDLPPTHRLGGRTIAGALGARAMPRRRDNGVRYPIRGTMSQA